jgi:HPr kinase/phosphorylase
LGDAADTHHGTAIAIGDAAALIVGPSGSGKSDLALRCLAIAPTQIVPAPAQLVADDRVLIERRNDKLRIEAPPTILGKLEVRGSGILTVPCVRSAELVLVVELVAPEAVERLPDPPAQREVLGVRVPALRLAPFEASAPLKLLLALARAAKKPGEAAER